MKKIRGVSLLLSILLLRGVSSVFAQTDNDTDNAPLYMDWNETVELFSEQENSEANKTSASYIDALVIMRNQPNASGKTTVLFEKQQIVRTFCDTVLQQRDDITINSRYFDHQEYRYDPRQSLFMYGLCVTYDERRGGPGKKDYKQEVFSDVPTYDQAGDISRFIMKDHRLEDTQYPLVTSRGLPTETELDAEDNTGRFPCDPKYSMQRCDFSNRAPKLYRTLMNEIVTMRQASIYGYRYFDLEELDAEEQNKQIQEAVKEFSYRYFMTGEDGKDTCNDENLHYLSSGKEIAGKDQGGDEGNRKHCIHPKTNKLVAKEIRKQATMLQSLQYLKYQSFFQEECVFEDKKAEMYRCGLSNYRQRPGELDTQSFHNVLVNELLWYNLFMTYYLNNLTTNNNFAPASVGIVNALNSMRDEVAVLTYEQQLATQAVQTTLRMLENIQTSYPIHIALQAYLEDVKGYRKQLAKVHTPMHQLYYLLRNVQACEGS